MAKTYKFGNGTWATKKGSTLAYSDTNNAFKPLPFSFERNSIGTRVNKEGLIEVVGNDIPRIDYTDSTEGALLLENSATNLVTYSEAFDNAYWIKGGSSVLGGFTSPKGDLSAFKLVEDTSTGSHRILPNNTVNSQKHAFSVFVKKDTRNWIFLRLDGLASDQRTWFDLENGVIGTINSDHNAEIVSLSNGWYRCSVSIKGTTYQAAYPILGIADADNSSSYTGNGTSGVYIYGSQAEENSVASSYIPTNGSTVQRSAETCNESGNSEVFNSEQGVLFANILPSTFTDVAPNYYKFISLSNGTSSNRLLLGITSASKLAITMVTSGGNTAFTETTISKQSLKVAINWDANYLTVYLNGFQFLTPLSVVSNFAANTLNRLNFNTPTSYPFYGKTKEIAYYDEILTDEELEYMTSYRSLNEMVTELNLNAL